MTVAQPAWHAEDRSLEGEGPEKIRAEIGETRERISHDLDEIGERLNPHNVKEDIQDGIREATIGRVEQMARHAGDSLIGAGSGIIQTIRDNPLPAAVAGLGLVWLFASRAESSSRGVAGRPPEPGTVDKAREKVADVAGQAQEAASRVTAPPVQQVHSVFQENPLAIAAGAIALGLVAGLLVPETRPEKRVMGDVGERIVDKVSEAASEAAEKATNVAQRAIEETGNAARKERLISSTGQSEGIA
jgi:hypothetical protein